METKNEVIGYVITFNLSLLLLLQSFSYRRHEMNVYWRGRVCPYVSFVSETTPQSSFTLDVVGEPGCHRQCSEWPRFDILQDQGIYLFSKPFRPAAAHTVSYSLSNGGFFRVDITTEA